MNAFLLLLAELEARPTDTLIATRVDVSESVFPRGVQGSGCFRVSNWTTDSDGVRITEANIGSPAGVRAGSRRFLERGRDGYE